MALVAVFEEATASPTTPTAHKVLGRVHFQVFRHATTAKHILALSAASVFR
jgi:hypothetical protein